MKPTQNDWDLHLLRVWYSNKYTTMKEATTYFWTYWRVDPFKEGFLRTTGASIMVWKFIEDMPKLNALLKIRDRDQVEYIANLVTEKNPKQKSKNLPDRSKDAEYMEMVRSKKKIAAMKIQIKKDKGFNRGEQWSVCK